MNNIKMVLVLVVQQIKINTYSGTIMNEEKKKCFTNNLDLVLLVPFINT